MNKVISTFAGALAIVSMSGAANAKQIVPAGDTTLTGSVNATVFGTNLTCNATLVVNASPNHAGDAHGAYSHTDVPAGAFTVKSFTLSGGGNCGLATITGTPYVIGFPGPDGTGITDLRIMGLTASSFIPGVGCSGNINGRYNNATKTLTIPSQTIPASPFGTCDFAGTLTSTTLEIYP